MNKLCTASILLACICLSACNKPANVTMTPETPAMAPSAPANTGAATGASSASSDAGAMAKPAN